MNITPILSVSCNKFTPQLRNKIHMQCVHYAAHFSFIALQSINKFPDDNFSGECTLWYGVGLHLFAFHMNTENCDKNTIKRISTICIYIIVQVGYDKFLKDNWNMLAYHNICIYLFAQPVENKT